MDAILNQYAPVSRRVIGSLENTKIISPHGARVNTIDLDAAKEKGITVANVPDYGMEQILIMHWRFCFHGRAK